MPNPSVTTNRLHFEDLEPRRFEELGYQLLHRLYKWERLDHTGVCGNDGGIDMIGILPYYNIVEIEEDGDLYYDYPILHCQTDELMDAFSKITAKHHHTGKIFDESIDLIPEEISLIHSHIETNLKKKQHGKS